MPNARRLIPTHRASGLAIDSGFAPNRSMHGISGTTTKIAPTITSSHADAITTYRRNNFSPKRGKQEFPDSGEVISFTPSVALMPQYRKGSKCCNLSFLIVSVSVKTHSCHVVDRKVKFEIMSGNAS